MRGRGDRAPIGSRPHDEYMRRQHAAMTGAGSGCLMALLLLPFTTVLALLRRKK